MTFFALRVTSNSEVDWLVATEALFAGYAFYSFVRVFSYVVGQVRSGTLLDGPAAPLPFSIRAVNGWIFIMWTLSLIWLHVIYFIGVIGLGIALFLFEMGRSADEQFGFDRLPVRRFLPWAFFICGAFLCVEVPLTVVLDATMTAINLPHPQQEAVETFRKLNSRSDIIVFLLQAVVIMPFVEELFFRGFLLTFLKNYTSTWMAIVLSAGVFAFAHLNLGSALQLWLLGIILGVAYQHTGSLLLSFSIHGCFNLISATMLLMEKMTS